MTTRIVQVGIADPRKGHAQLDALEAEGFAHESTILGRDGTVAVVTMRQGPQTVRDCALYMLSAALYEDPTEFCAIVEKLRRGEAVSHENHPPRQKIIRTCAAMLDCFVGDGLDMRIVDPRAVVDAPPKPADTLPAPAFVLNEDTLARSALFRDMTVGDDLVVSFKIDAKGLRALVDGMFVTGDEAHEGDGSIATPTLREFLRFGERFPTAVFTGSAKPPADGQSNLVIDGVTLNIEPMPWGGSQRYQAMQVFSQFKNAGASHFDADGLVLTAKWGA